MANTAGPKIAEMSRLTRGGRKLTYQLQVIQQPERARACGSGAKSSADRRPVDPPPVVELRIFEGGNDVTFSLNANFFLYATLEPARPIAQGRVPAAQPQSPVLTGFPVSSMAYLDRPNPAGYFIFPDLSVRHEGKYKLAFNLYEEVKEDTDFDAEPALNHPDHPANKSKGQSSHAPKEHFHWRLEVQSLPFTVYSAKKFPGLAESTALSRIVAEQGCRVRIRRDVRMRRRETKAGKEYDEYEDEQSYSHETPAPDMYHGSIVDRNDRTRSIGGSQAEQPAGFSADRRTSAHESHYYQPQQQHQPAFQTPFASTSAPPLAPTPSAVSSSQAPFNGPHPPSQAQYNTPSQSYSSTSYSYSPHQQHQPQVSAPQPQSETSYSYPDRHNSYSSQYSQQPAIAPARADVKEHKAVQDWRQGVASQHAQYAPRSSSHQYSQPPPSSYASYPSAQIPRTSTPSSHTALPPLKPPMPMEPKYESAHSPSVQTSASAPMQSPNYEQPAGRLSAYSQYAMPPVTSDPARNTKRSFGQVFESSHFDHSLANGSRPNETQYGVDVPQPAYDEDEYDNAYDMSQWKMQYKRADGTEISRRSTALR